MTANPLQTSELCQRLGLEREPFPELPDGLLLNTHRLAQRMALIRHLLMSSTRPVLLLGPRGAGVTTLIHSCAATLRDPLRCAVWTATPLATTRDLMHMLLENLDGDTFEGDDSTAQLVDVVRAQLVRMQAAATTPVLLIDNAHELTTPVLEALLELGDTPPGWLRLVFAGDARLESRLAQLRSSQQPPWLARVDVPRLSAEEVIDYLNLRLAESGWEGNSPFTEEACATLHTLSEGRPGLLNALASETLEALAPAPEIQGWSRPELSPRTLTASVIGVAAVCAATWALWPKSSEAPPEQPTVTTFELPSSGLDRNSKESLAKVPGRAETTQPVAAPEPSATLTAEAPKTATTNTTTTGVSTAITVEDEPVTVAADLATDTATPISEQAITPAASTPPRPHPPPRARVVRAETVERSTAPSTSAPAKGFGIQLVAFGEVAVARAYIVKHQLEDKAHIYRVARENGTALHAVIVGRYEKRNAAKAAIAALPLNLRATSPWPRDLSNMKKLRPNQ
jgi:type II secretory pathway predicted ATPase ExeA